MSLSTLARPAAPRVEDAQRRSFLVMQFEADDVPRDCQPPVPFSMCERGSRFMVTIDGERARPMCGMHTHFAFAEWTAKL